MRVLMLANPDSVHTLKWVRGLTRRGVEICLLGLQKPSVIDYSGIPRLRLESAGVSDETTRGAEWSGSKLAYLRAIPRLRSLAGEFAPSLVHAHYLTSYGLIAALSGVRPLLISVWGSDIFLNPQRSWMHRSLIRFALARADAVSSTSHAMAVQTRRFCKQDVRTIAFGIDPTTFSGAEPSRAADDIVIGTVKTLHENYGVDDLLRAFALLHQRLPDAKLRLRIVGDGPQRRDLEGLAATIGVAQLTTFVGAVPPETVPQEHRAMDIFVALSKEFESFGVAVIEAGASARPVVVSNVGGLPEVVRDGKTGFVVPRRNPAAAADALERLVLDSALRARMGAAGRAHVIQAYDFERNIDQMLALYSEMTVR